MIIRINSLSDWEDLIEKSKDEPVVVLRIGNDDTISSTIHGLIRQAADKGELFRPIHMLIVQDHRDISDQVTIDTGVEHETPQVIILRSGHSVYNANHYGIKIQDIKDAIERNK